MIGFLRVLLVIPAIVLLTSTTLVYAQKTDSVQAEAKRLIVVNNINDRDVRRLHSIGRAALATGIAPKVNNVTKRDIAKIAFIRAMPQRDFAQLLANKNIKPGNKARLRQIRRIPQSEISKVYEFYNTTEITATSSVFSQGEVTIGDVIIPTNPKSLDRPITGYVLTHEHPMVAMAFGGNYAFTGASNNFSNGIMTNGYTASCSGCRVGQRCDHGEVKGNILGALGALGGDMGNHSSRIGPHQDSFSHVRYSTQWIKEAYSPPQPMFRDTRMRIMVAFAVDNEPMCETLYYENLGGGGTGGNGYACTPGDSIRSLERQIQKTKDWAAANSSWMQIAYNATEARRIANSNKLVIILGVESDYTFGAENKTFDPVNRLNRLYNKGVRTFYMAHKVNSRLTGADVFAPKSTTLGKAVRTNQAIAGCFYYDDNVALFPLNRVLSRIERATTSAYRHYYCDNDDECGQNNIKGFGFANDCNAKLSDISETNMMNYVVRKGADEFNGFAIYPSPPGFSDPGGTSGGDKNNHYNIERNNLGLSTDGDRVVRAAMRKGMIINIDHVSSKARIDMREISREFKNYPLNAFHNRPNAMLVGRSSLTKSAKNTPYPNEYDFDDNELRFIKRTGGFFGAILGPMDAKEGMVDSGVGEDCPRTSTENAKMLAYLLDKGLSVGYSLDFATVTKGFNSRTFEDCELSTGTDIMEKFGVHTINGMQHIGMMKKFHKELEAIGMKQEYLDKLRNDGAEQFLRMWERSETKADTMQTVIIVPNQIEN
ncbi:membrane dipeptidase [Oceanicaulis sp. AH-315-P02]|nr:membrane dipeptidase [Robiginitomaculum sp.]MBN4047721.1 membrane dipeptidase [Oceanicaulis sp. AH-315-P02]